MDTNLVVVGTIEPVNDASVSFQVAGQVASVSATPGAQVTAGEPLASLDTTALSESVSSAELSLQSADAKLTEDEDSETASTDTATTTTTVPKTSSSAGSSISQDQAALVTDQATSSGDQQQEAADLKQAQTACGLSTTPTSPPSTTSTTTTTTTASSPTTSSDTSGCTNALQQVSTDQQSVAKDQQAVAADESTLAKAITAEESAASSASSTTSKSSTGTSSTGTTGSGGTSAKSNAASDAASNSATQIATDEAAIDTAQANVVGAEQSLTDGQLTSPINGTIVSVGINVGETVGADSSTDDIVIIGTKSFEATATLTSAQVPSVKVGLAASVAVDGTTGSIDGAVSQVGPVQSTESGYSYPVVIALPASANNLFAGSTANISIVTGTKKDVLAVPTSAVTTSGTRAYVVVLSGGNPVDKPVKIGLVGSIYTQVLSGVKQGQEIVLANDADPVPASNTETVGGFGSGGFGGGTGGFGGGTTRFNVAGSGGFGG